MFIPVANHGNRLGRRRQMDSSVKLAWADIECGRDKPGETGIFEN